MLSAVVGAERLTPGEQAEEALQNARLRGTSPEGYLAIAQAQATLELARQQEIANLLTIVAFTADQRDSLMPLHVAVGRLRQLGMD
jgi:hypothetical protein